MKNGGDSQSVMLPKVSSSAKVVFTIDDCLTSFEKLQPDRHEKWLKFLWLRLPPERMRLEPTRRSRLR